MVVFFLILIALVFFLVGMKMFFANSKPQKTAEPTNIVLTRKRSSDGSIITENDDVPDLDIESESLDVEGIFDACTSKTMDPVKKSQYIDWLRNFAEEAKRENDAFLEVMREEEKKARELHEAAERVMEEYPEGGSEETDMIVPEETGVYYDNDIPKLEKEDDNEPVPFEEDEVEDKSLLQAYEGIMAVYNYIIKTCIKNIQKHVVPYEFAAVLEKELGVKLDPSVWEELTEEEQIKVRKRAESPVIKNNFSVMTTMQMRQFCEKTNREYSEKEKEGLEKAVEEVNTKSNESFEESMRNPVISPDPNLEGGQDFDMFREDVPIGNTNAGETGNEEADAFDGLV